MARGYVERMHLRALRVALALASFTGLSAAISALGAAGCTVDGPSGAAAESTATTDEALYLGSNDGKTAATKWPGGVVPVCFADTISDASLRAAIPGYLAASWSSAAGVTFTGFGACDPAVSNKVTVTFVSADAGRNAFGYTSYLGQGATSVLLTHDEAATSTHFEYEVIHEFGHVLGFAHEQQRPDNWRGDAALQCPPPADGSDYGNYAPDFGGTVLTPTYDASSIMNYCDPLGNNTTTLSAGDVAGALRAYPFPTTTAPSITSVVPSSGPNQGGNRVTINGAGFDTTGRTQIAFGTHAASGVQCASSSACSALVPTDFYPSGSPQTLDVHVTVGAATSRLDLEDRYTLVAGPSCTSTLTCAGIAFGFPDSVATCKTNVDFYILWGLTNADGSRATQKVGSGTTWTFDTNDVGEDAVACDPLTLGCTPINTYEASSTYCGAVPKPPSPLKCNGASRPIRACSIGWRCCGTDGWSCGVCF